ncbi:ABC transporter ATP-binding protein [Brucella sp. 21LCYQ03]|nr:ABC transporter ATP-binding protein [Brucella sp. 21LCYQ03]
MNATLNVAGATVEFSGLRALDNVSLSLAPCEIVGLIGPNGSGKTTLINAITGQVPITSGSITLGDRTISGLRPRQIALGGISRSFQIVRLFNNMTVIENIEAAAIARGDSLRSSRLTAERLIEEFKLEAKAHDVALALNYGDKRRVEIARALASNPKFLLLDEPAAGMNDAETELLLHTLTHLPSQRGLGIMIIDHDMALIMRLCHRLHVLASGKTIAAGSGDDVRRHPEVIKAYLGSAGVEIHAGS